MDLDRMGDMGLPVNPDDFAEEITESVENYKRSIGRRDAEIEWALEDLAKAGGTALAGIDFLMAAARAEGAHESRHRAVSGKLGAVMLLKIVDSGKCEELGLPDLPDEILEEARKIAGIAEQVGEATVVDEPSGEATIEGIGSFDDLPVIEKDDEEEGTR